jgi:hypothetical protein
MSWCEYVTKPHNAGIGSEVAVMTRNCYGPLPSNCGRSKK